MSRQYLPRIADEILRQALLASGAVCIQGPKWCGKTWTALQQAGSTLMMQDPDQAQNYMSMAEAKPSLLLEGEVPRLLDEWQVAPVLWDAVRFAVDKRGEMGQSKVEQAASNLLRLKNRIDKEKMHAPSFLMVLTANGYAMRRNDGVIVVPLTCLAA